MGFIPDGVANYSAATECFVVNSVGTKLVAGVHFVSGQVTNIWCAACIHQHGQPNTEMVDEASSIDIAHRIDDPNGTSTVKHADPASLTIPYTECDKCGLDIPLVEAGDRPVQSEAVEAEIEPASYDGDGFEEDVSDLADSFKDRFD